MKLTAKRSRLLLLAAVLLGAPGLVRAQPGAASAPAASHADSGLVTVTLRDGQLLRGRILAETRSHIVIELVSGGEMAIEEAQIRDIKRDDPSVFVSTDKQIYKHDPNRTRYLYGSSAFMLRSGEGYFSQTELMASTLGFGVTDWLTIQVGSIVPALAAGEGNAILGARVGKSMSENLHVAAGITTFYLPELGAIGMASGSLTLGTPRTHLTVTAGRPFAFDDHHSETGPVLFSVAGNVRLSKQFALLTENWVIPDDNDTFVVSSFAGRFMGEHSAVDVGMVLLDGGDMPLPWLDFTWNWE